MIWIGLVFILIGLPMIAHACRLPMNRNARAKAPCHFAELSGGLTHYHWTEPTHESAHEATHRPVVVCIHGLSTPSYVWDAIAKGLATMGFRVLTYDLYGRGFSDRPKGVQNADFFINQLNELLQNQDVEGNITLLGYSMGGAVATAYTAHHADRLERLILLAPAGLGHDLGRFTMWVAKYPIIGDWLYLTFGGMMFRRNIRLEASDCSSAIADIHARQIDETRYRGFLEAVLSSLRHMLSSTQAEHEVIAKTAIPVLAIWGEGDDVIPLSGMESLAKTHRNAHQISIPDAPHGLPYTHPKDVLSALQKLLGDTLINQNKPVDNP